MGPMLTAKDRDRVLDLVKAAEQDGATIVCGGKIPEQPAKGYFLEPTILRDVRPDHDAVVRRDLRARAAGDSVRATTTT